MGYEKRQFALRSIEFNIKSRVFNELFPDLKREAEEEIKRRKDAATERNQAHDPQARLEQPWIKVRQQIMESSQTSWLLVGLRHSPSWSVTSSRQCQRSNEVYRSGHQLE